MLDISDIKNQQQQAAAAHARLDNLIASSPAVIYVQRYLEGALQPSFFSASLQPLLGWSLEDCNEGAVADWVHPEDRDLYFQRCRQLLREGNVHARYRLRDRQDKRRAAAGMLDRRRCHKAVLAQVGHPVQATVEGPAVVLGSGAHLQGFDTGEEFHRVRQPGRARDPAGQQIRQQTIA